MERIAIASLLRAPYDPFLKISSSPLFGVSSVLHFNTGNCFQNGKKTRFGVLFGFRSSISGTILCCELRVINQFRKIKISEKSNYTK